LITPLVLLAVYTFVFSVIFNSRWEAGSESKVEFSLLLFCGLIVFNVFSESVNQASDLILNNANYVKKVVFPLELLPWVMIGTSLFHATTSLIVWLIAYTILVGAPSYTVLYAPFILIPFVLFVLGLCWFIAALGVYVRDISQLVSILTLVMMFLSPIFYPSSVIPSEYKGLMGLNPLLPVIEQFRNVLYWQKVPDFEVVAWYSLNSSLTAWFGFCWFQMTRRGFADVL
jgi:lipopolysaccharide transport system permease protein